MPTTGSGTTPTRPAPATAAIAVAVAGVAVLLSLLLSPLVALAVPALPTSAAGSAAGSGPEVASRVVVAFADEEITESSGLVARGRHFLTVNDSGDEARIFTVDARTGETVEVTWFSDEEPDDVEALAPGPDRTLWVGDIGDNRRSRGTVQVTRLRSGSPGSEDRAPGAGTQTFELAYPDGPHDAEALLVHPRSGRVLVVTKVPLFGGTVFAAPPRLDPGTVHRLSAVGRVSGLVTDGAFFPDGRHLVLRTYDSAAVYTYPGLERVGSFALPGQEQGEAVAVAPGGRVYLSSEGSNAEVLEVKLPADVRTALSRDTAQAPSPSPSASPTTAPSETTDPAADEPGVAVEGGVVTWLAVLVAAVGAGGLGIRAARRRGRRRR